MHKRIVYTRPDGGVSVITPTDEFIQNFNGTEDEALAFIQSKDVPADATNVNIILDTDLPDRTNREAWTWQ